MRTRICNWFDEKSNRTLYGYQVYSNGRWCYVSKNGTPLLFETPEERDIDRKRVRAMRSNATTNAREAKP